MGQRIQEGEKLPFFRYDTPYSAQNRLRELLADQAPLVLVFMSNFGHPITRTFAGRYANTRRALQDGGFALVVRSRADKLSDSIGPDTLPYPLMCDAQGVLYDLLDIPRRKGTMMTYSLEGWQILRAAKKQGYRPPKDVAEQLPLTLILDTDGTVLFCHYGTSLTDVPTDCAAMQSLLEELDLAHPAPRALRAAAPPRAQAEPGAARLYAGPEAAGLAALEPAADDFMPLPARAPLPPADPLPPPDLDAAPAFYARPENTPAPHYRNAAKKALRKRAKATAPSGDFATLGAPVAPIQEYAQPDLEQTAVLRLFDDPYGED